MAMPYRTISTAVALLWAFRRAPAVRILRTLPLGLALVCAGAGCGAPPAESPAAPAAAPAMDVASQEGGRPDATESGELRVRLRPGTVVRSGPGTADDAVAWLEDGGLYRVLETTDAAYRIEITAEDGAAPTTGWVPAGADGLREVRIARGRQRPRLAPEPDPGALATAGQHLQGGGREWPCGPYQLLSDVSEPELLGLCGRLAADLDAVYAERFGVDPVGEPRGAVILFRTLADFRDFAATSGGHAGHARASRGYLSLYVGDRSPEALAMTLAHELTHLVNRRALGASLPRWLSEGLADAIGDPATPAGLGPSTGLRGAEVARRRVLEKEDLPDLRRLTELDAGSFDSRPDARDYEQSAVFIRFLLADAERRRSFHAFLRGVAGGESPDLDALIRHLGARGGAKDLDRQLRAWLETSGPTLR